ncbi:hypothetical protein [Streptantibioticus ferralitis]|uniref:Uncharacterized protein n=1 Tax=Streptantibioticus ferralitis TaxID=236510 RepID=A0ABT5ZAN2_9ACTN|nr:hypothetical protein [Streptantibioticus ferralitis]MDF2260901.1 hypothetical protein [Streptantibioticus ferralitis]
MKSAVVAVVFASLLTAAVSGGLVIDAGVTGARGLMWSALFVFLCSFAAFAGLLAIEYQVMRSAQQARNYWTRRS